MVLSSHLVAGYVGMRNSKEPLLGCRSLCISAMHAFYMPTAFSSTSGICKFHCECVALGVFIPFAC